MCARVLFLIFKPVLQSVIDFKARDTHRENLKTRVRSRINSGTRLNEYEVDVL